MAGENIRQYFPLGEIIDFHYDVESVNPDAYMAIRTYLAKETGYEPSHIVGSAWIDENNLYPGTMPKRYAKWYFKNKDIRLSDEVKKKVGDMAMAGIVKSEHYLFDFTDKIDWQDGAYGDTGACFLTSDVRRKNMAMYPLWAMRFYDEKKRGIARCWLAFPTEESIIFSDSGEEFNNDKDLVIACNAYNDKKGLNLSRMATILEAFTKLKKIRARVTNAYTDVFYTNAEMNYQEHQNEKDKYANFIFYPPEKETPQIKEISVITLNWDGKPIIPCSHCGTRGKYERLYDGALFCDSCWDTQFFRCFNCDYRPIAEKHSIIMDGNEWLFCERCATENAHDCQACDAKGVPDGLVRVLSIDGVKSNVCIHHKYQYCPECHSAFLLGHPCHPPKVEKKVTRDRGTTTQEIG